MMDRSPWRSPTRPRRDDEVSVPEAGMMEVLLDFFFFFGSIVARNLEGFYSKRRSIERKGVGRQCSGVYV